MKRHLFRLAVTMLALCSGTAFASIPGTRETLPQTAGDQSLTSLLGLIALGVSGVLVQLRRPRH